MRRVATYRANLFRVSLLGLLVLLSACDSAGDDDDDSVSFVGTWAVTKVAINGTNFTAFIIGSEIESMDASFTQDGSFELVVVSGGTSYETSGTYALSEQAKSITLSAESFAAPLTLQYAGSGSESIVLTSTDAALLTELSGIDPAQFGLTVERVDITITRQN